MTTHMTFTALDFSNDQHFINIQVFQVNTDQVLAHMDDVLKL